MLTGRGLSKSLPSMGVRRTLNSHSTSLRTTVSNHSQGRQFGTLLRKQSGAGSTLYGTPSLRSSRLAAAAAAAPLTIGGINTSRHFSLSFWNYGSKKDIPAGDVKTTVVGSSAEAQPAGAAVPTTPPAPTPAPAVQAESVATSTTAPDLSSVSATAPDLKAIEDLINGHDILNLPDGLGYLHALGLDYGWGPTSVMQWVIEHIHVWGDLSYGATFLSIGFVLRAALFWPHIKQLRYTSKMAVVRKDPRFKMIQEMRMKALSTGDTTATTQASQLSAILNKEYNVSNWGLVWSFIPIPFSFGLFRLVKGMTDVPVPGLENAGFAWFTDLTVSDPYFVLPVVSSLMFTGSLMAGMKFIPIEQRAMMTKFAYILTPLTLLVACWFSAGLNLIATSVGAAAFVQTLITNTTAFRRAVGLSTEIPTAAAATSPSTSAPIPTTITYQAPTSTSTAAQPSMVPPPKSFTERISNSFTEAQKSAKQVMDQSSLGSMMGAAGTNAELKAKYKAESDRRKQIQQTEKQAEKRRREEWNHKFKR